MSLQQMLIETLEPLTGLPVVEDFFGGDREEYITFSITDDRAVLDADDDPQEIRQAFAVHAFLKKTTNYLQLKKKIRRALHQQGCDYPAFTVLNEPDEKTRHLIFESAWINNTDLEEV